MKGFIGYTLTAIGIYCGVLWLARHNFDLDWVSFLLMLVFLIGLHLAISSEIDNRK